MFKLVDPDARMKYQWANFCRLWWFITDDYDRKTNAAPEPPSKGYYWVRDRTGWSIAEYDGRGEWYVCGGDYSLNTVQSGIREWRGPLEEPK
jgi:hypothetical protein